MNAVTNKDERFFLYFPWFILFMVVACFAGKAIFDYENLPPITPFHHVHAIAMLSWFTLFAVQPTLIHFGKVSLHRRLGKLSPLLVLTFVAFAIPMSLINWQRIGDPLIFSANLVNFILFLSLYSASIYFRKKTAAHKRLMLYATLTLVGPALGRLAEIFSVDHVSVAPMMLVLLLLPIVRDLIADRRVHPFTWIGFAVVFSSIPIILGLSTAEGWHAIIESVLSTPNAVTLP